MLRGIIEEKSGHQLVRISLIGQGMCNNAWLAQASNGRKLLVKQERVKKLEEENNDLATEALILQKLNEKKPLLPIPRVVFFSPSPKVMAYEYQPGRRMSETWKYMSAEARSNLCRDLGAFHSEICMAFTDEELAMLNLHRQPSEWLEPDLENDLQVFLNDQKLPLLYRNSVEELHQFFVQSATQAIPAFCHNDSHHDNIIVHKGRLSSVIDFGDACLGDVHWEFIRYVQDYPDDVEVILQTFEELSGLRLSRSRILAQTILDTTDQLRTEYFHTGKIEILERYMGKALNLLS